MLPGQILPGQMSLRQYDFVQDGSLNLPLKFGQIWVSNNWDNCWDFSGGQVAGDIWIKAKLMLSWGWNWLEIELRLSLA